MRRAARPGEPALRRFLNLGLPFAGLRLGYLERGEPSGEPVLCVHGLTRNAHDFDTLALALAGRGRRVIAVDVAGRGRSGWLADPKGYTVPTYARHLRRFLELLGLGPVDWVGTSMGGLIGLEVAAEAPGIIRRLILNDIGPAVPPEALAGIRAYLGLDLRFSSLAELEAHLRLIHAGFGALSDAEWRRLARHSARRTPEGWRLRYDPAIREPFAAAAEEGIDLWEVWERVRCPVFVLRGAESPLLTEAVVAEMRRRGPPFELATVTGAGHAPALNTPEQVATVARWLGLPG